MASIVNFQQFVKIFLDRWIIKVNLLVIIEEYNQLRRQPDETIQQFSDRFNQAYYSMPSNIRPPPDSALLHYPRAFDPEIEFQLRERNPSTLEHMQNMAVDVEVNLQIRREKLKVGTEKNNVTEVKLDIFVRKIKERIQKITMKDKFFVQNHHGTFISQKEEVDSHEQIPANSNYHRSEDRFIEQYVEKQSADQMCMFDDITSFNDFPKYDQYDDNYVLQIQTNFTEQSEASLGNKEIQFQQLENDDHLIHIRYESEAESAENLEISEASLPLCFESFQFLKEMWYKISKEKDEQLVETYEVQFKPICNKLQQSFQVVYDPITDRMDNECNQNFSPLTDYESQNQDDNSFTRQTFQSVEVSSQSSSESLQGVKDKSYISVSWHGSHPKQVCSCLKQLNNSVYILEDPFIHFLEPTKESKYFLIFSLVDKVIFGFRTSILITNNPKQQNPSIYIMLEWLH